MLHVCHVAISDLIKSNFDVATNITTPCCVLADSDMEGYGKLWNVMVGPFQYKIALLYAEISISRICRLDENFHSTDGRFYIDTGLYDVFLFVFSPPSSMHIECSKLISMA